jgi:putative exosortase-associated protein (TIGR04073 family)
VNVLGAVSRKLLIACLVLSFALVGTAVAPQSYDPDQDIPNPTIWQKRLEKLGRGVANVLFGWAEIPRAWHQSIQQQRPFTQIITHGTIVGTSRFFIRTGLGIYETFSFYTSNKERKYEPFLEPEYLF